MRAGGGGEGGARASLASLVAHHRSTRYDEALSGFAAGAWRGTRRRRLMMKQERGKQAGKPRKSTGPATTWAPTGSGASEPPPSPLSARRAAEKIMADLQRLLEEKDFSSIEEANHFLEELMASGGGQIPTGGRSARADKLLREALEENARVPAYLLGEKELPVHLPELVEWGGESEAVEYVEAAGGLWFYTPGALEWLKGVWEGAKGRGEVKRKGK